MKRRTFLKNTGALSLATFITPAGIFQRSESPAAQALLDTNFKSPPWSARPHTWWHWMNGNVTKEGITLDLEAMAQIGLGGFQNFDAGTGIPKGPVQYLSSEWLELKKHAIAEAARLGLEFTMHNCPGWSSSGGPWITPELAMQEVTWSELVVQGGKKVSARLPQPLQRLGFYKDIRVVAFKAQDGELPIALFVKRVAVNDTVAASGLLNGSDAFVQPLAEAKPGYLQIDFTSAQPIQHVAFRTVAGNDQRGPVTVQYSVDGTTFTDAFTINTGSGFGGAQGELLINQNISPVKAVAVRIVCNHKRNFSHIRFSNVPRAAEWAKRANYAYNRTGVAEVDNIPAIVEQDIVDITSFMKADGTLEWNAPIGNWTILRFGFTPLGTENRSAPDSGVGLECDKYSARAIEFHFDKMMASLLPSLETLGAKGKVGLLIDSYEVGMQNWTEGFENIFQQQNSYDLIKYLPALTGRVVEDAITTDRFLWDFRRTQGNLMAQNYYGKFTALCHKNNIISYCQPYDRGPMEEMQIGAQVDTNVGEFWNGLSSIFQNNWTMRRTVKLSAAIAHTNAQKIVAAESYTGEPESSKWQEYPFGLKTLGDRMFTQGLNRMVFHRFAHQPHPSAKPGMTMGPWGSHFDRTNTWWEAGRAWVDYLSRCQFLLQEGIFVADIAYFTGEDAGVYARVEKNELKPTPPQGYDYDLINADTLLQRAAVKDNKLLLPDGITYRVLVLQDFHTMSLPLLRKIEQFANEGLIVMGAPPKRTPGLHVRDDAEFKAIVNRLWGGSTEAIVNRAIGKGKIVWGMPVEMVLHEAKVGKDFAFTSRSGDAPVVYLHRRTATEDIFFLANQRRTSEDLVCEFRIANKQPECWNQVTGDIKTINTFAQQSDKTIVPLTLPEGGSAFVVFRKDAAQPKVREVKKDNTTLLSTRAFTVERRTYADVRNNFAISLWAKPENNVMLSTNNFMDGQKPWTDYFAVYPSAGEKLYGTNHATCGLVVGRNGVAVWEHARDKPQFAFSVPSSLSGWSHVVLQYAGGKPSVYINGVLAQEGPASAFTVHPGVGHVFVDEGASFYNGDLRGVTLYDNVLPAAEIKALSERKPATQQTSINPVIDNGTELIFFQEGTYAIDDGSAKPAVQRVHKLQPVDLSTAWDVIFSEGLGAPPSIKLNTLVPLNEHADAGVKYFSGTCTYKKQFDFTLSKDKNTRYYLDLGSVEVLADVQVNSRSFGVLWTRPFTLDVTAALVQGKNTLEIRVTNLWPNRLIGDEQAAEPYNYAPGAGGSGFASLSGGAILELPEWYKQGLPKPDDGRVAFATWKHYTKESPLLQSGLIGPVVIRPGYARRIES